jgi:general secretion pathway protein E
LDYECKEIGADPANPPTLYQPPQDTKLGDGFKGRSGIYEVIKIDDQFRTMIHDGASEHLLEQYARTLSPSIREDGIRQVLDGTTTLEEVLRVTRAN